MSIRQAEAADIYAITEIYNDAIINTTAVYDYHPYSAENRLEWLRTKKQNGFPVFVYEQNGQVQGYASYGPFRPWAAFKYSIEHSVYVHPGTRGAGVGRALLRTLIDHADQEGFATMIAGIDSSNPGSIYLHETEDFEYVGTVKKAGYKFERWLDLIFYQRALSGPETPVEQ
ncbi:phosphinothricin acetyltransferase [Marinococcus luteus]|uniref:Phosphinothricin acetyltransferase n=1 Tax=Marinococcus luteus TaxID=1122204 RepID=A0A1H2UUZ5_9BACI|nr:GNAT family N-acetyltransferase [Marinococcus luteus]SDW59922.1 phosphinothricin acetyltransferase [Marinococcus luteus]